MTALPHQASSLRINVRYFAGAKAAAGIPAETVHLTSADGGVVTVSDVLAAAIDLHDDKLAKVLPACSFLLDGVAVRDQGTVVDGDATLDVLPPFAGG